ncbi:MAG: HAD-IA family hydrolase [Dehalococcoidales bacterium]|nr:HAD-IA family hydrolase [Dehalococcoidales bacterium]
MTEQKPAIFWDFDGTLVLTPKWSTSLIKAMDILHPGHDVTREQIRIFLHEGFPWHTPERYHPELSSSDAWLSFVRPVLAGAVHKVGYETEESGRVAGLAQEIILDSETYIPYDDTLPVLLDLHQKGWRHVILSNNYPELPDVVSHLSFSHLIADCITSGLVGYEKPNPCIFEYALERAEQPEKVWMVGDNIEADVRGAEAAGIPAILVHTQVTEKPGYYAANLHEVTRIIDENSLHRRIPVG